MLFLPAVSISRSIQRGLSTETLPLTVVARFANACDFVAADGRVCALVNPKVGNGPLNIVVDARLADLPLPPAGAVVGIDEACLRLGEIEIGLACAEWDPRPDIDIVVDLKETHIQALAAAYPPPRYYADPEQMRSSIRMGISFNIIDGKRGEKADLSPLTRDSRYRQAFGRRIRYEIKWPGEASFMAWCARPDDVIYGNPTH